ncbi:MAG: hypothetical protein DRJ96_06465 [Thermoprotei archaeon]|nr:MAG: hypothetical protein DRJ96_06465 [Thermoprotei archaeon]
MVRESIKPELTAITLITLFFGVLALLFELGVFARKVPVSEMKIKVVESLVPLNSSPTGLAAGEDLLWVSYPSQGLILGINLTDGTVARRLTVKGMVPTELAYGAGILWIADALIGQVIAIDPSRGEVVERVCEELVYPTALAYYNGTLYVYDAASRGLMAFSGGKVTVLMTGVPPLRGLTASEEGLWLLVPDNATLLLLSWEGFSRRRTYYTPTPAASGLAWDGRYLWVGDYVSFSLLKLDPTAKIWKVVNARAPSWLLPLYLIAVSPFLLSIASKASQHS